MTNDWPFGVATAINDHLQNLGFTTSLTHHDTTGGKSSYLGISDPQTGRYLNKIRMSDHLTGPIRASQETHINKPEDVRKIIDWANDLRAQGPTQYWKDKKALEDAGLGHLTGSRREKAITRLRQPLIAPISKQDGGMIDDPEKAARQAMTVARGVTPDERQANFQRWFGNSKAVDPKGNPLVLYHGTQNNFNQFRPHGIGTTTFIGIPTKVERHGIFMSPHPEFASSFAQQGSNQTGANVMPLHVRMENPLKMDRNGLHPNDVQNLASHGINEEWLNNSAGDPRSTWEVFEGQDAGWFTKTIQDAGYDGVHMEEKDPATGKIHPVYVAFHPTQIKSAIGNQGTYNLNDPDINKASGGMIDDPAKSIRRAVMVAKGLAKEIGPLPTGDHPKPPHPASMIPGVHVTGMGDEHTAIPDGYADGGDVTSNPNFSQWFGNSVTHDNGVPRTYYTGTSKDKDFTSFNVGRHGAWFTTDPHEASQYAESNDSQGHVWENGRFQPTNTASRVIPAYLKAENPYTGERPEALSRAQNYKKAQSDWFDTLRAAGHDSWMPSSLKGNLAVMLRHPTQIKSAIGNSCALPILSRKPSTRPTVAT